MKVCGGIFYEFLNQNLLNENKFTEILHCVAKEEGLKKNLHYTLGFFVLPNATVPLQSQNNHSANQPNWSIWKTHSVAVHTNRTIFIVTALTGAPYKTLN